MLAVDVPSSTATRAAPYRSRTARTASAKPSWRSASQARRVLRQSPLAGTGGSGHAADPAIERRHAEIVGRKAATRGDEGIGVGLEAAAEGGGGGIRANG